MAYLAASSGQNPPKRGFLASIGWHCVKLSPPAGLVVVQRFATDMAFSVPLFHDRHR